MLITGTVAFAKTELKNLPSGEFRTKHIVLDVNPQFDKWNCKIAYDQIAVEFKYKNVDKVGIDQMKVGTLLTIQYDPRVSVSEKNGEFKGVFTHNNGYYCGAPSSQELDLFRREEEAARNLLALELAARKANNQSIPDTTQPQAVDAQYQPVSETTANDLPF